MKICIITVAPVPSEYDAIVTTQCRELYAHILRKDTEIHCRGLAKGPAINPQKLPDYRNTYFNLLLKSAVVEAALKAETDGFDAVIVNCFDDPGVIEARGVVTIPVFGICEPSLHFCSQLGRRFGALVPDLPGQADVVEQQVRDHGLSSRLLTNGVRTEPKPFSESQPEAAADPAPMVSRLRVLSEQLVKDGASVILAACGGLGEVCERGGFHNITVNDQVIPVVRPLAVAIKHTEMMLDLQRAYDMPIPSQGQDFARLSVADKQRIQQGFDVI